MRRFLRRLPEGGQQVKVPAHNSVGLNGASYMTHPNNGGGFGDFAFFGVAPFHLVAMMWVQLHSKALSQDVFRVGTGANANADNYGFRYNAGTDRFEAFVSFGGGYQTLFPAFSPSPDHWYFFDIDFGDGTIALDSFDIDTGIISSISVGVGSPLNVPAKGTAPLGVGASGSGANILAGRIDSFALGFYDNTTSFASSPTFFNNGKALNFSEVPANSLPTGGLMRMWMDFNEPSGAATYVDASAYGANLTAQGTGLTRQHGAGY